MFRACLTSLTRGSSGANSGESGGGEDTPAQPSPYTRRALNEQLRQAAEAGDTNTVAHVLAHGANPRMRCSRAGLTVLHYAVFGNHVAVAQTLLAWCLRADSADGRSFDIVNARDAVRFLRQRTVVGLTTRTLVVVRVHSGGARRRCTLLRGRATKPWFVSSCDTAGRSTYRTKCVASSVLVMQPLRTVTHSVLYGT